MIDLQHGDCLELMKSIPDGSIDMILCDLPYGTTQNKWDSIIPLDEMWEQYKRITKPTSAICLFSQMPFSAQLVMSNPKMFRYEWVLEKANATGFLNAKKMPMKAHETMSVFYDNLPSYNPIMEEGKPYVRTRDISNGDRCYGKFSKNTQVSTGGAIPKGCAEICMA
jgi:site-specific DNA-methyltransferase (adenine-specific)